jgi:hypothetical protein
MQFHICSPFNSFIFLHADPPLIQFLLGGGFLTLLLAMHQIRCSNCQLMMSTLTS